MFDTNKVAKNIKKARTEKNMTQMDLADAMGVSYQAVSNWERGNSMPDISKLPELCTILGISFEELVGGESKAAKAAKKIMEDENASITLEELADIAPMVKPKKIEETVKENAASEEKVDLSVLIQLAPFLEREELDALALKVEVNDPNELSGLAPFLSKKALDALVDQCMAKDDFRPGSLAALAPFLSKETIRKIMSYIIASGNTSDLSVFAPFMGKGFFSDMFSEKMV